MKEVGKESKQKMRIRYEQIEGDGVMVEFIADDLDEIENLKAYFQRQNVPVSVHPYMDCEGTWFVSVMVKNK